jgi:hypothetical protein
MGLRLAFLVFCTACGQKVELSVAASGSTARNVDRATGKVVAYIGVRSGSMRCPNKVGLTGLYPSLVFTATAGTIAQNKRRFADDEATGDVLSLIDVKIRVLQASPSVAAIVVSSDDEEMLAIAARYDGVQTLKREPYYASSDVSVSEYFQHVSSSSSSS